MISGLETGVSKRFINARRATPTVMIYPDIGNIIIYDEDSTCGEIKPCSTYCENISPLVRDL